MKRRAVPIFLLITLAASVVAMLPAAAGTEYALSVTKTGKGGGLVTSDGMQIDCGATCEAGLASGTMVILTADPNANSTFSGWTGDCSGTGTCDVTMNSDMAVNAKFDLTYRPDAVVKLCGLSTGCKINPLPHPWKGNNVYNTTGAKQTIKNVSIDNGEGVRFWIRIDNDGALADTIFVQGCQGNSRFIINKVVLGKHKKPEAGVTNVTADFLDGTLDFSLPPASEHKHKYFTLNILTQGMVLPVKYTCRVTISSQGDPSLTDKVVMKMDMY
jgi:hypothetical protein